VARFGTDNSLRRNLSAATQQICWSPICQWEGYLAIWPGNGTPASIDDLSKFKIRKHKIQGNCMDLPLQYFAGRVSFRSGSQIKWAEEFLPLLGGCRTLRRNWLQRHPCPGPRLPRKRLAQLVRTDVLLVFVHGTAAFVLLMMMMMMMIIIIIISMVTQMHS